MLRLRLFRILLPLLLVAVVVLLVWAIRPIDRGTRTKPPEGDIRSGSEQSELRVYTVGSDGELRKTLEANVEHWESCGDQCYDATGIRHFGIAREGAEELVVLAAANANIRGPEGDRDLRFSEEVRIEDPELGVVLQMPALDVDEASGEARSDGAVHIEGANHVTRAERLVYGLTGQPTRLDRLEMRDDDDGTLSARRALLHDGLADVEFQQGVRYRRRDDERFWAETARVRRGPEGDWRRVQAAGNVVAAYRPDPERLFELGTDDLVAEWGDDRRLARVTLAGNGLFEGGAHTFAADLIRLERGAGLDDWSLHAEGAVTLTAPAGDDLARLRADRLDGRLTAGSTVVDAEAVGSVQFETSELRAEAERAVLEPPAATGAPRTVRLAGGEGRRARLAQARYRVVADRIVTTGFDGGALEAAGRVESTLLPGTQPSDAAAGMFRTDRAIHFISSTLRTADAGARLTFEGAVRGWQGEQNLSAESIVLDQKGGTLEAREHVTTRLPRARGEATRSDDFVQVTADALDYSEPTGVATYRGAVRTQVAEGRIESELLRVRRTAADGEGDVEELTAEGAVQLEFEDGDERTIGRADRLVYLPARATIWLYGDEKPAEVRRPGEGGGTTRGRVLRYRLDDGSLAVESGRIIATPQPEGGN